MSECVCVCVCVCVCARSLERLHVVIPFLFFFVSDDGGDESAADDADAGLAGSARAGCDGEKCSIVSPPETLAARSLAVERREELPPFCEPLLFEPVLPDEEEEEEAALLFEGDSTGEEPPEELGWLELSPSVAIDELLVFFLLLLLLSLARDRAAFLVLELLPSAFVVELPLPVPVGDEVVGVPAAEVGVLFEPPSAPLSDALAVPFGCVKPSLPSDDLSLLRCFSCALDPNKPTSSSLRNTRYQAASISTRFKSNSSSSNSNSDSDSDSEMSEGYLARRACASWRSRYAPCSWDGHRIDLVQEEWH